MAMTPRQKLMRKASRLLRDCYEAAARERGFRQEFDQKDLEDDLWEMVTRCHHLTCSYDNRFDDTLPDRKMLDSVLNKQRGWATRKVGL